MVKALNLSLMVRRFLNARYEVRNRYCCVLDILVTYSRMRDTR